MADDEIPADDAAKSLGDTWLNERLKRPTGRGLASAGLTLAGIGAIVSVVGLTASNYDGDVPDLKMIELGVSAMPALNSWKWPLTWAGAGIVSLGFTLWCIGQVVFAMFFLPGRDVTYRDLEQR